MKLHRWCWLLLPILCGFASAAPQAQDDNATETAVTASPAPERSPYDTGWIDTRQMWIPGFDVAGVRVRVFLPPGYRPDSRIGYPVLYLNDGQDADTVALQSTLNALIASGEIVATIAVAIDMPSDRMAAYGFTDRKAERSLIAQTRHGPVGAQAQAYSEWVVNTLVPSIDTHYRTRTRPDGRTILGWSLGAASALNLGWQYPEVFGRTGAFSPSLWLPASRGKADDAQRSRIAQQMIARGEYHPGSRWFFAVGDAEESDDRDGDGVIDVLDDTRDLIDGWHEAGSSQPRLKGLRQLGHSVNLDHAIKPTRADAALYVLQNGEHNQSSWSKMLPIFLRWAYAVHAPALNATGRTDSWQAFASQHVAARDIDIWLPPSYDQHPQRRYPVLYMHDGQNLFDPAFGYTGVDWDIDGVMTQLIARGEVREAIVVGIWNTPQRFAEYMPRAPVKTRKVSSGIVGRPAGRASDIVSDHYLRFLTEELKPFVDAQYRTMSDQPNTFVMGSSMGGLISLYAGTRYPDVYGGIGAVSTHWPICGGCMVEWLRSALPKPGRHRIYFDHGTATLDASYPPYQARMDAVTRAAGYSEGRDWITRRFEGAEHNEAAWKARVEIPLRFLLEPISRPLTSISVTGCAAASHP